MSKFDLEERLINFSVLIIQITDSMPTTRSGNHLAGQLLISSTSPALNYGEAQSGESRKDFIHKISKIVNPCSKIILIYCCGLSTLSFWL